MTIIIDAFYIPWDVSLNQNHITHVIHVIGIDIKKVIVYCSDIVNLSTIEVLSLTLLSKACQWYIHYKVTKKITKTTEFECMTILAQYVKRTINNSVFEKIREFSKYLCLHFNIDYEFDNLKKIEDTPLITSLINIGYSRVSFSKALECVKVKYRKYELDYFIDSLNLIGNKWRNIALIFGKYKVGRRDKFNIEKITPLIYNLASAEEKLAHEFLELLNNGEGYIPISYISQQAQDGSATKILSEHCCQVSPYNQSFRLSTDYVRILINCQDLADSSLRLRGGGLLGNSC